MTKEIKSINAKNFITAIQGIHGDVSEVTREFYQVYPPGVIDDPNVWMESGPVVTLFRRYLEWLGTRHPDAVEAAGQKTADLNTVGKIEYLVRLVTGPRIAFSNIPKYNKYFNDIFDMEIYGLSSNSATLVVKYKDFGHSFWSYEQCWWTRGIISSIPVLWNLPNAQYRELLCFFSPEQISATTGLNWVKRDSGLVLRGKKVAEKIDLTRDPACLTGVPGKDEVLKSLRQALSPEKQEGYVLLEDIFLEGRILIGRGTVIDAGCCAFFFHWKPRAPLKRIYDLSLGRVRRILDSSRVLEEQLAYAQQQFFEIDRLYKNLQIQSEHEKKLERVMAGGFAHEMRNALTGAQLEIKAMLDYRGNGISATDAAKNRMVAILSALDRFHEQYAIPKEEIGKQAIPHFKEIAGILSDISQVMTGVCHDLDRGLSITGQIREYADLNELKPGSDPVDAASLLREYGRKYGPDFQRLSIQYSVCTPEKAVLYGSEPHLNSIFSNLVLNARDALDQTPPGKPRALGVEVEEKIDGDGARMVFRISDNGPGIPHHLKDEIFEPFFSTKPSSGRGLGLAVVRKLVAIYGGTVEVSSEKDRGTTFTVVLPAGSRHGQSSDP